MAFKKNCLAKALYENNSEAPDELAFRKGDILTVLEQNTNGLEGWWLCALRGRQGIVPGNRLRLLPGMYDPTGLGYAGDVNLNNKTSEASTVPNTEQRQARRRTLSTNPTKVVMPEKVGDVYLYDVPLAPRIAEKDELFQSTSLPHRSRMNDLSSDSQGMNYDAPPSPKMVRHHGSFDDAKLHSIPSNIPQSDGSAYSEPRSQLSLLGSSTYDAPNSHDYDVPSSEDQSSYDIPGTPRLLENKKISSITSISRIITISDSSDAPQPIAHKCSLAAYDVPAFSRSSGETSSSSSFQSPSGSHCSMDTLSLSSVSGSNRSSLEQHPSELYDIPPEPQPVPEGKAGFAPCSNINSVVPLHTMLPPEVYDVPSNNAAIQYYDSPVARIAPMTAPEGVYDIPPQVTREDIRQNNGVDTVNRIAPLSNNTADQKEYLLLKGKELHLDREAAMETLVKLQNDVQGAISKLFSFVSATWRKQESFETKVYDIEVACHKIQESLVEFLYFAQGTLANSMHASDKSLFQKLNKVIKPLVDSNTIVQKSVQSLDDKGWHTEKLSREEDSDTPDELDQLVACTRGLVEDVRQVASFIQGNSTLLFKRIPGGKEMKIINKPPIAPKPELKAKLSNEYKPPQKLQERPLPLPPVIPNKNDVSKDQKTILNEYEYVNLESKDDVEKENEAIKAILPPDMQQSFENLLRQSEIPVDNIRVSSSENINSSTLDPSDIQLLHFYGTQMETHIMYLTTAIDAFLLTVKKHQPPKVFVGHSKFIVVSAHKLVYIADTVQRNIHSQDIKEGIMQSSNNLCDSLKLLVENTKKAAVHFPSVAAVQEMIDSVVDISHLASDLRISISQGIKV